MRKPIRGNVPTVLTDDQIIEFRKLYAQMRQIKAEHAYSMLCLADTTIEERRFFAAIGDLNTYSRSWDAEQAEVEDLYDAAAADEAYADYVESGCKSTPADEFWQELDAEQPNEETIEALEEVERLKADPDKKDYESFQELLGDLDNEEQPNAETLAAMREAEQLVHDPDTTASQGGVFFADLMIEKIKAATAP